MEITEQQNEIIENNGGKLTPELAAQLIDQELHGDTANAENGSAPETTQACSCALEFSNASQKVKVHPTQKPVALLEYLIKT